MAFEVYRLAISNPILYDPRFVSVAGENSEHWPRDNWKKREESLRHDQVCALLMNTASRFPSHLEAAKESSSSKSQIYEEGEKQFNQEEIEGLMEAGQMHLTESFSTSVRQDDEEESEGEGGESGDDEDDEFAIGDYWGPPEQTEEEMEEMINVGEPDLVDSDKRYTILEGVTGAKYTQIAFSTLWGIDTQKQWDIIDKQERKFIEVKITSRNPYQVWEEVKSASDISEEHFGACIVHDEGGGSFKQYVFNIDEMPGWKQVEDFLIRRYEFFLENGAVPVAGGDEDRYPVWDPIISEKIHDWIHPLWQPDKINARVDNSPRYEPFNIGLFLNLLDDPRARNCSKSAKWNGKLMPFSWNSAVATTCDKDLDMVEEIIRHFDCESWSVVNWKEQSAESLVNGLKLLLERFKEGFIERNSYIPVKKTKHGWTVKGERHTSEIQEMLSELGIGWKFYKHTGIVEEDMRQPESEDQEMMRWDDWLTELRISESQGLQGGRVFKDDVFKEAPSFHILDEPAKRICTELFDLFRTHKIGATCAKVMNFYSRMGGTYLRAANGGKSKMHSSLAILPLYYKEYRGDREEKTSQRVMVGFVVRGPHHVRDATDTINLIIAEKVNLSLEECKRRLRGGVLTSSGWFIRKNAIRKADPTYLSFLHNSLFVPVNFLGELITNHPQRSRTKEDPKYWDVILAGCLTSCRPFHLERIVETVLMGIIGKSQEEGYHDMLRKVYMLLMARGRGEIALVMDLKAMAEEMNECLINSAYVFWVHCELLDFMKFVKDKTPFNEHL
ncbi:polymerase acidic protein [Wellfleet Bay virus]|uniref:Polymerase acidic protein n=1 Tax=Wellfleet Bay virus TaxID=1566309 RepID=A0A0A1E5H9_9ORTO|nr:polymerase acidic protein [Wellfleet Bay virus]AIY25031.1 polymerase acidic protein [Wellfleet Bay virus]